MEEEFLQIQVVEASWSLGRCQGQPGMDIGARGSGRPGLSGRDGMGTVGVGNGDGAQGSRTQPLLSSIQTTAKGLPRRVPSAPKTDPALQVRGGRGAPVSDPSVAAPVLRLIPLSLSRCTTTPAVSAPCAPAPPALPAQRCGGSPIGTRCAKSRWCFVCAKPFLLRVWGLG